MSLFPNPAWNGFLAAGNRARTSSRHLSRPCGRRREEGAHMSQEWLQGGIENTAGLPSGSPDLKLVRSFLHHLAIQGRHQPIRRNDDWPQRKLVLIHVQALEVVPREASLPYRPAAQVYEAVSILLRSKRCDHC